MTFQRVLQGVLLWLGVGQSGDGTDGIYAQDRHGDKRLYLALSDFIPDRIAYPCDIGFTFR